MNALIIDDNEIARTTVKKLASRVDDIAIVAECSNAMDAYNLLQTQLIDLLLLDIEMPGMTGLELTKNLINRRPVIVFITSKKEYAVDAFDLNVADYIIKPVTSSRWKTMWDKSWKIL